ncbi:MAG TPA: hypothetical protein PLP01_00775 [Phycisphaerae bacterium]|nr:hypothetical protein [Phycisphaerae bacterium]HOI53759.1 hypothetical protein [Phycisphaerae bacterium]
MDRKHRMVMVAVLGLLVSLASVGPVWADDAAPSDSEKKANKDLDIDWGTGDKTEEPKKDDPDAAAPSKEVDLSTALDETQTKRLDIIKKSADKGDEMAKLGDEALSGEKKGVKKEASIRHYENASGIFLRASGDIEKLARPIQDQDVKLTLLRNYADVYKNKACEMLCKAGNAAIDTAGMKVENLKAAVKLFKKARAIDPSHPDIAKGVEAAKSAYADIQARIAEQKAKEAAAAKSKDDEEEEDNEHQYGREDKNKYR